MANSVENLIEQSVSDCVAYTEFMLQYKKSEDILYCFFEGFEDRTFYSVRIDTLSNAKEYNDYICGGKEQVLAAHKLIKENPHYKEVRTGFFVDNDFDNIPITKDVYVTPTYSIENLYCCQEAFEKILISEFKMKKDSKDFTFCVDNYLDLQDKFNAETLVFNSWLACQADYRSANNNTTRLKIDKKVKMHFEKIVLPNLNSIRPFPEIQTKEQLQAIFSESPVVEDMHLDKKINEFKLLNQTDKFRGKFLIRFLESYLSRLQSIFGVLESPFENKYSCSLRLECATICSNLSQYARTTKCLKEYIKRI